MKAGQDIAGEWQEIWNEGVVSGLKKVAAVRAGSVEEAARTPRETVAAAVRALLSGQTEKQRQGAIDGEHDGIAGNPEGRTDLVSGYGAGLVDHHLRRLAQPVPLVRCHRQAEQGGVYEGAGDREHGY